MNASTNDDAPFQRGERVTIGSLVGTVVTNDGDRGVVLHDGAHHPHSWLWTTSEGEPVRRVME